LALSPWISTTWSFDKSNKMRLSADAMGVNAAKKTLEIKRKLKEIERRRCWDMVYTEFVPCFEDAGRTRKRSRELSEFMIAAAP
jgi:hypothetical protein